MSGARCAKALLCVQQQIMKLQAVESALVLIDQGQYAGDPINASSAQVEGLIQAVEAADAQLSPFTTDPTVLFDQGSYA